MDKEWTKWTINGRKILTALDRFWSHRPALLYGLAFLLGISAFIEKSPWIIFPVLVLILSVRGNRLVLAMLLGMAGMIYVHALFQFPFLPEKGLEGTAYINISSLIPTQTHFGKFWTYKGTLHSFRPASQKESIADNIPYTLSIPRDPEFFRPSASPNYRISAKLRQSKNGHYILSVHKDVPWYAANGSWSLTEYRFKAKRAVAEYIQNHIWSERATNFLTGLAIGEFDDRLMIFEFNRFGLQHLMAISGFHFSIISAILGMLLTLFFPLKKANVLLMVLLTSYCLFLGWTPSVMRAWITIMIALVGQRLEKEGNGLNSLGIALLVILLIDPLAYQNMGFQFSFATTAAILLFFQPMHELIMKIFPKRPLSILYEFPRPSQHAYVLLTTFRNGLALTGAVTIIALPMTLFFFHKFPVLSLVFNLFFPFLVSFSMLFLILGILWAWIPAVSHFLHLVNTIYTESILNIAYNFPAKYDTVLHSYDLSGGILLLLMSIIFIIGFIMKGLDKENESNYVF